ncbi:DUF447 domain-containing protein [Halorarius halobius]|uniref:DUF447 domain-containing protein n=1 Tax=Halorarius halobius TaxID=2962671 RepID=UPI0020CE7700|nr:DUF447 domain-containing protein [Halorarius halobius]
MTDALAEWPADWDGVAESVVTTRGPNDRWNVAALGLHAPDGDGPVTARTWGRTRTWHNFGDRGEGYVQFTRDPVDFVEAACAVREEAGPVLDSADAWARVRVEERDSGTEDGTGWVEWALHVEDSSVERETVPVVSRAHGAVVEATVAASRLDVDRYDTERLRERIRHAESVVDRAGGARDREAWDRFEALVDWRGA